jgi:hypothetical protein
MRGRSKTVAQLPRSKATPNVVDSLLTVSFASASNEQIRRCGIAL